MVQPIFPGGSRNFNIASLNLALKRGRCMLDLVLDFLQNQNVQINSAASAKIYCKKANSFKKILTLSGNKKGTQLSGGLKTKPVELSKKLKQI